MKKHSIKTGIIRCFVFILLLSIMLSAAANFYVSYTNTIKQHVEYSKLCAKNMTNLLNHQWSLEDLSQSTGSDTYIGARHVTQQLCKTYELEYLYVYTIDPERSNRFYYLVGSSDPDKDAVANEDLSLKSEPVSSIYPGEQALLDGSREIQRADMKTKYGDTITWLAPYIDSEGNFRAIIGIDYKTKGVWKTVLKDFLSDIIPFIFSLLIGLLILLFLVEKRVISPIRALSNNMKLFAEDSSKKTDPLNIPPDNEIGEMAASFDKMTNDIRAYINNIESLTQERLETNVQLDVARRIQYGLVPKNTNMESESFCLSASTRPAKAVGGDFYDCFLKDEDSICVVMGDVSGKGISAAIFMSMSKTIIREKLLTGHSPAEALNQANDELCASNPENLFVTVFAGILNLSTGEFNYANAGHTYPVLLKDDPEYLIPENGIALGLFEDSGLEDQRLLLHVGEGILLYTDGVTEAINPQKTFFGTERLLDALKGLPSETTDAKDTVFRVSQAVKTFCDGNEPFDDMAALALYFKGKTWHRLPVERSSFEEIKSTVFSIAGETMQARLALLACDEILSNIVQYSGATTLDFACEKEDEFLRISFIDDGVPFNPMASKMEEKEFEDLDKGGMGLNLIRQIVLSMNYERKDDRNIFTFLFEI